MMSAAAETVQRWAVKAPKASPLQRLNEGMAAALRWVLALYIVFVITKLHEVYPVLGILQPVKLTGLLLIWLAFESLRGNELRRVVPTVAVRSALVIVCLAVLSAPFGLWPGNSIGFLTSQFWKTMVFFIIAAAAMCDRRTMTLCFKALTISGILIALKMMAGGLAFEDRSYVSTAFDPNESALLFLAIAPFALNLATGSRIWRLIGYGGALILVGALVKTGSRGGMLGLLVVAVWMICQARPGRRLFYMIAVLGGTVVFAVSANASTRDRLFSIFKPKEDYNYTLRDGRYQIWKRGVGYMLRHPVLGVGPMNFPVAEGTLGIRRGQRYGIRFLAAHNSFVEIGAELGVIGLGAFCAMLWSAGAGCHRIRRRAVACAAQNRPLSESEWGLAMAAQTSLVAFLVSGSFLSFAYHPLTFLIVAVCVAVRIGSPLNPMLMPGRNSNQPRRRATRAMVPTPPVLMV